MKKIIFAMAIITSACIGCQKSKSDTPDTQSTTSVGSVAKNTTLAARGAATPTQTYNYKTSWCAAPANGCLPNVVVKGTHMEALLAAIDGGTVTSFFQSPNNTNFISYIGLDSTTISNLQTGAYQIIYFKSTVVSTGYCFLIGTPPVSPEGYALALPLLTND